VTKQVEASVSIARESGERFLRVHSVLFLNQPDRIRQTVAMVDRAVDHAIANGFYAEARMVYGDCSPVPVLSEEDVVDIRENLYALSEFEHFYFGKNLGSALGHNRLLEAASGEDILIINPDIMLAPDAIVELAKSLRVARVGMAEAKQLPIEHPKCYDPITGETSWAATACTLIRGASIVSLGGFDHESFFLYCDDVDFSWRIRLGGEKVVYVPTALAFHDKRLGRGGQWVPGAAERFYSAEAALFLSYKYSREDLTERWLSEFEASGDSNFLKAAASFRDRKEKNALPQQIDREHRVAQFLNGNYAEHRFGL